MAKFLQFIDAANKSATFPADSLVSMTCQNASEVLLKFSPSSLGRSSEATVDTVSVTVIGGSETAVMTSISNSIAHDADNVVLICDDVNSKFLSLNIRSCSITLDIDPMVLILNDADQALTHVTAENKTLVVPAIAGNRTYTIPTPTKAGQHYKFVYGGAAVEAQNVLISTGTGNSVYMKGGVAWMNSTDTVDNGEAVLSDGNSNELLTLVTPGAFEINLVSYSTTEWYVYGWVVADSTPTMGD